MQEILTTLVVPAVVKLVQELAAKNVAGAAKIVLAALAGAGLGYVQAGEAGLLTGLMNGLAAAGVVTVAAKTQPKVQ